MVKEEGEDPLPRNHSLERAYQSKSDAAERNCKKKKNPKPALNTTSTEDCNEEEPPATSSADVAHGGDAKLISAWKEGGGEGVVECDKESRLQLPGEGSVPGGGGKKGKGLPRTLRSRPKKEGTISMASRMPGQKKNRLQLLQKGREKSWSAGERTVEDCAEEPYFGGGEKINRQLRG